MAQEKAGKMRIVLSALALCMVAQQSLYNNAQAGMITGIAPEIGADGNKIYNIDPSVINGDIGFRLYEEFQLNKGEIANLIFKYYGSKDPKDIKTFVNLVDNKIDINGLVNTMRDGNFYNGHAIFVSPNGMVVGASGVLNVGSLTVLTPEQNNYNKFKSDYDIKGPLGADTTDLYTQGTGTVTIDGKVISRDLVDIRAAGVDINNSIIAGVGNNKDVLTTHSQADVLFNSLVNTDNMKAGNFDMVFNICWGMPYDPQSSLAAMRAPVYGDYAAQLGLEDKAEIDQAITDILTSTDETERQELYTFVLTRLHEDAVYIPLTYECNKALYTSELQGVHFGSDQYDVPFADMYFE